MKPVLEMTLRCFRWNALLDIAFTSQYQPALVDQPDEGTERMKMFVEPSDIYLYLDNIDFRKSINGLIVVV